MTTRKKNANRSWIHSMARHFSCRPFLLKPYVLCDILADACHFVFFTFFAPRKLQTRTVRTFSPFFPTCEKPRKSVYFSIEIFHTGFFFSQGLVAAVSIFFCSVHVIWRVILRVQQPDLYKPECWKIHLFRPSRVRTHVKNMKFS